MMSVRWLWLAMLLLTAPLHAAPAAVVETVLMPAWLYRDAGYSPLQPGMALQSGDTVLSGSRARVQLRLEEGSTVKLGEYARFELDSLAAPTPADEAFRGALSVVKGAFRLTTSPFMKHRKREISVRIATITVGIRGTDIWGKVNPERDLLALLEGNIEVAHDSGAKFTMQEPLTYVSAPRNAALQPIQRIAEDQLKVWAAETEPQPGSGLSQTDGAWKVRMGAYRAKAAALRAQGFYRKQGYAVDLEKMRRGPHAYRLMIHHLTSHEDAEALAAGLRERFGLEMAQVANPE
jgi:hypothetical protein